jgi:sulfur carrier protein
MKVKVNGNEKSFERAELTISELLKLNDVEMPEMVSVQLNQRFVDKSKYDETKVSESDNVDFLYFMGGGAK